MPFIWRKEPTCPRFPIQVHQDFQAVISLCLASPVLWPLGWFLRRISSSAALTGPFLWFGFCINVVVEGSLLFIFGRSLDLIKLTIKERKRDEDARRERELPQVTLPLCLVLARNIGSLQISQSQGSEASRKLHFFRKKQTKPGLWYRNGNARTRDNPLKHPILFSIPAW